MLIEYKDFHIDLTYSAQTKSYFGEIEYKDLLISFQATNRQNAVKIMHHVVDTYLQPQQEFALL